MSEKYPRPEWAASIWISGDILFVDFESHTIQIPLHKCSIERSVGGTPLARQLGWNTLLTVLRDRESAGHKPVIAAKGAPVQYDIEGMLKAMERRKPPQKQETSDDLFDLVQEHSDLVLEILEEEFGLKRK